MRNQRREQTWSASPSGTDDASPVVRVGARIGSYRVDALLGEGGAARVWRVHHVELGVERALKVLKTGHGAARLAREARLQAEIEHAHVVRVYDVIDVAGQPALVMALSHAGSLAQALQTQSLDPAQIRQIGHDLARGLAVIHARGIVHRDIKPSNILLMGPEQRAALTDFGIAREPGSDATQTRDVLGTPAYMAPEQLRATAQVGPSADMYAFGVVLYELFMHERPSPSLSKVEARLARLPAEIARLIGGCLGSDPAARPDAVEAAATLKMTPVAPARRGRRWGVAGVVGVLCVAALWLALGAPAGPVASPPPPATIDVEAATLRRAFERLSVNPGEAVALWRAAHAEAPPEIGRTLWDAGGDVRVVPTQAEIVDVLMTPDGRQVVGLTSAGWVHLWDRQTGERLFAKDSSAGVPASAHLSADGRLVAVVPNSARSTSGRRSQVRVLDLATGKVVFTASNGDTTNATYFRFSPDSARALTYSNTSLMMTVLDVRTGAQTGRVELKEATCSQGAAFGPNSEEIAALDLHGTLRIYGRSLEARLERTILPGNGKCTLRWTQAHGLIASAGGVTVRVDPTSGAVMARADVSGDLEVGSERLVVYDQTSVTILDAQTLTIDQQLAHPRGVLDVVLDGSGELLATAGIDGLVRIWSAGTGRLLRTLRGHRSWVHALVGASKDGWELWSAGRDRTLRAWRLPEPEGSVFDFSAQGLRVAAKDRLVFGWTADTVAVHALDTRRTPLKIEPVGAPWRVLTASADGTLVLERRGREYVLHTLGEDDVAERTLGVEAGFKVWIVGQDPVRLVVAGMGRLRRIDIGPERVSEADWPVERNPSQVGQTRDGQWLFMTSYDSTLTIWRAGAESDSPSVIEMGCAQPSFIERVGPSSVVLGDWAGCIERWDIATGTRTTKWAGHEDAISQIETSPSGSVSAALDGTLRVWDDNGRGRIFGRHTGGAFGFVRDGDGIVSIGADRAIRRWFLDAEQPGPVEYIPNRPKGIWGANGTVRVVDEDGLIWTPSPAAAPQWGNLRVCRERLTVVPIVPFPQERDVWAPRTACPRMER